MNADGELLAKVSGRKDLFQSVLYEDRFDDWNLARDLGEFLVQLEPDSEIMGHAILTRAYRHLGARASAIVELERCRTVMRTRQLQTWETELFPPLLDQEERLL